MILYYKGSRFHSDRTNFWSVYEVYFAGLYDSLLGSIRPDDVVLDAGSNIGAFAIAASKKAKKVYAFEPHPRNFAFLVSNARINRAANLLPFQIGLSSEKGVAHISGEGVGAHLADDGPTVELGSIDELCSGVSLIKMDIEGSEVEALFGAAETLNNVRQIVVETHGTANEVHDLLVSTGFSVRESVTMSSKWAKPQLLSSDFLANELTTRFILGRQVLREAIIRREDRRYTPIIEGIRRAAGERT